MADEFGGDEYGDTLEELLREWDDTDLTIGRLMDTNRMGMLIQLLRSDHGNRLSNNEAK